MADFDIRWRQRLDSYKKALAQLTKFIEKENLNELEEQGLIQSFEYTHELAWKLLKDYLLSQNIEDIYGSRDAFRAAFNIGLIKDGEGWMETIKSRNQTSHAYNQEIAEAVIADIRQRFFTLFTALRTKMQDIQTKADEAQSND